MKGAQRHTCLDGGKKRREREREEKEREKENMWDCKRERKKERKTERKQERGKERERERRKDTGWLNSSDTLTRSAVDMLSHLTEQWNELCVCRNGEITFPHCYTHT